MPYPGDVTVETARKAREAAIAVILKRQEQAKLDREQDIEEEDQELIDVDTEAGGNTQDTNMADEHTYKALAKQANEALPIPATYHTIQKPRRAMPPLTVSPQGTARLARAPRTATVVPPQAPAAVLRAPNPVATTLSTLRGGLNRMLTGPNDMMMDPEFREFVELARRIKKGDTE